MPRVGATRLVASALRQHISASTTLHPHISTASGANVSPLGVCTTTAKASTFVQQCTSSSTADQIPSHPSHCSCGSCSQLRLLTRSAACSATTDCQCAACSGHRLTRLGASASSAIGSSSSSSSSSSNVWCRRSSSVKPDIMSFITQRGFSCFSAAVYHEACSHTHHNHGHHHDEINAAGSDAGGNTEKFTDQIRAAKELQELQQVIQQHSSKLAPSDAAAAFRQTLLLTANSRSSDSAAAAAAAAAAAVLQSLTPSWLESVQQASITDLSDCLFSCSKLGFKDTTLWSKTLAVVPSRCADGDGRDLANIAYALALMAEANGGNIPGVSRDEAAEVLRVVTQQVVSMVSGPGGASDHRHHHHDGHDHSHDHDGGGCGHDHKSGKKSVTIGNISTVRWAHEVFDSLHSE